MSVNAEFRAAFEHVFVNQAWGDKLNAGVNYVRKSKKTKPRELKRKVVVAAPVKGKKK